MPSAFSPGAVDLSIIIPSKNEAGNLQQLLPELQQRLDEMQLNYEILIVDAQSQDGTQQVVEQAGAHYIAEATPGYGAALVRGFAEARGEHFLTMDADLSHPAEFVQGLYAARDQADIIIASRYVAGGSAEQVPWRAFLSKVLNNFFRSGLSMNVQDLSSGFRLYRRGVFRKMQPRFTNFVVLVEILLLAMKDGRSIQEIPFDYKPRGEGRSNAQVFLFGLDYLRLFHSMWKLRNSVSFPDYDWRAHDSRIPLQRYWQRRRHKLILQFTPPNVSTADVGCGSSKILADLPHAIGIDMRFDKLRFMRKTNRLLVQGDGCRLPFPDEHFECVISSQVLEHIPAEDGRFLDELTRILKPGGTLVLGTPDYGNWEWRWMEKAYDLAAPGAYAEEHVTHYTYISLKEALVQRGYKVLDHAYILRGELIFKAQKTAKWFS